MMLLKFIIFIDWQIIKFKAENLIEYRKTDNLSQSLEKKGSMSNQVGN